MTYGAPANLIETVNTVGLPIYARQIARTDGSAIEVKTEVSVLPVNKRPRLAVRSLGAAALIYSKAPHIVGAFDEGAVIRSKDGFWLAIPTEAAGKSAKGGRITPGEWERRNGRRLKFVYRRGRPGLLVDRLPSTSRDRTRSSADRGA